jgi:glutamate-1-semialdehyde 2,1-aminomutase
LNAVEKLFAAHGKDIAAVIVEPIAANMGVVTPEKGFLQGLREITRKHGALLIVDEVITGFRLHYGAVQQLLGIEADLTTMGKIIGGGLPAAAYGGRAEVMNHVAPLGPVYQAGTLAGNPLAMSAGIATLKELNKPGLYEQVNALASRFVDGLKGAIAAAKLSAQVNAHGSLATIFFAEAPVRNYQDAKKSNTKRYARYFGEMLDRGIFLAPSQFEAAFVSMAHTDRDMDRAISAARESLQQMAAADGQL